MNYSHHVWVNPYNGQTQICYTGGLKPSGEPWREIYDGDQEQCNIFAGAWRDGWKACDNRGKVNA